MKLALRLAREVYERVVLYLGLIYFGAGGVLCTALCVPLFPLLPRGAGRWLGRRAIGALFRGYLALLRATGLVKLDLDALDCLRQERPLIVAPNHPCLLDAVLVISRLPDVACVTKAGVWDNPVLGGGSRLAGYIRNDSPVRTVRRAAEELKNGRQLLMFPEGTRSLCDRVGPFKGGFALIAKKSGAPVQTVFIETNSAFLGKGWPLLKKPDMPVIYRVRLGRRFHAVSNVRRFARELEEYYRRELGNAGAPAPASFVDCPRPTTPSHAP